MREITQYTVKEWLKLDPIIWFFKEKRNDAISRSFVSKHPPELEAFLEANRGLENKNVGIIVAFNSPWVIDVNLPALKKHFLNAEVIVCDNSNNQELRRKIESVCRKHDVPYIGLPPNPERHPCRSHGIALNWIYYNIIRTLKPCRFGCLDHDLIPFRDVSMDELLHDQPVYGRRIHHPWSWYLWAGFSMFDYTVTADRKMNFLNDRPSELDTGGRNWKPLMRELNADQLNNASMEIYTFSHPEKSEETEEAQVIDGSWIHLCGVGMRKNRSDKFSHKAEFFHDIFNYFLDGNSLAPLVKDKRPMHPAQ